MAASVPVVPDGPLGVVSEAWNLLREEEEAAARAREAPPEPLQAGGPPPSRYAVLMGEGHDGPWLRSTCPALQQLPPALAAALTDGLRPRFYEEGEILVHQGDAGSCLYVVLSGAAAVHCRGEEGAAALPPILDAPAARAPSPPPASRPVSGEASTNRFSAPPEAPPPAPMKFEAARTAAMAALHGEKIAVLGRGRTFGEGALAVDGPPWLWPATILAEETTQVLCISRQRFQQLLTQPVLHGPYYRLGPVPTLPAPAEEALVLPARARGPEEASLLAHALVEALASTHALGARLGSPAAALALCAAAEVVHLPAGWVLFEEGQAASGATLLIVLHGSLSLHTRRGSSASPGGSPARPARPSLYENEIARMRDAAATHTRKAFVPLAAPLSKQSEAAAAAAALAANRRKGLMTPGAAAAGLGGSTRVAASSEGTVLLQRTAAWSGRAGGPPTGLVPPFRSPAEMSPKLPHPPEPGPAERYGSCRGLVVAGGEIAEPPADGRRADTAVTREPLVLLLIPRDVRAAAAALGTPLRPSSSLESPDMIRSSGRPTLDGRPATSPAGPGGDAGAGTSEGLSGTVRSAASRCSSHAAARTPRLPTTPTNAGASRSVQLPHNAREFASSDRAVAALNFPLALQQVADAQQAALASAVASAPPVMHRAAPGQVRRASATVAAVQAHATAMHERRPVTHEGGARLPWVDHVTLRESISSASANRENWPRSRREAGGSPPHRAVSPIEGSRNRLVASGHTGYGLTNHHSHLTVQGPSLPQQFERPVTTTMGGGRDAGWGFGGGFGRRKRTFVRRTLVPMPPEQLKVIARSESHQHRDALGRGKRSDLYPLPSPEQQRAAAVVAAAAAATASGVAAATAFADAYNDSVASRLSAQLSPRAREMAVRYSLPPEGLVNVADDDLAEMEINVRSRSPVHGPHYRSAAWLRPREHSLTATEATIAAVTSAAQDYVELAASIDMTEMRFTSLSKPGEKIDPHKQNLEWPPSPINLFGMSALALIRKAEAHGVEHPPEAPRGHSRDGLHSSGGSPRRGSSIIGEPYTPQGQPTTDVKVKPTEIHPWAAAPKHMVRNIELGLSANQLIALEEAERDRLVILGSPALPPSRVGSAAPSPLLGAPRRASNVRFEGAAPSVEGASPVADGEPGAVEGAAPAMPPALAAVAGAGVAEVESFDGSSAGGASALNSGVHPTAAAAPAATSPSWGSTPPLRGRRRKELDSFARSVFGLNPQRDSEVMFLVEQVMAESKATPGGGHLVRSRPGTAGTDAKATAASMMLPADSFDIYGDPKTRRMWKEPRAMWPTREYTLTQVPGIVRHAMLKVVRAERVQAS